MVNTQHKSDPAEVYEKADFGETFNKFIIENIPVAIVTVNADFRITGFNPWAEKVTGYSEKEALGRSCGKLLQGANCRFNCPLKGVLKHEKPLSQIETTFHDKHGKSLPVRVNTAALFDDEGYLIGGVEAFHDISRLKAMEREKDNLISMFAHDMKSSISIIGGFALRLLKKADHIDDGKREKYLEVIKKESGNLDFMVEDFLEFARLETGKLKLDFAPLCLDKELMELYNTYQLKAKENKMILKFQTDDTLPVIEADARRLRRVFTNLLDNAFKFSRSGAEITLTAQETADQVIVKIQDQGSGIDSRDIPYIFDAFHRGRGTRKEEGSGVGLAAVKAIIQGHGGHIHVESELGNGSAFTVILPKNQIPVDSKNNKDVRKI